MTGSNLLNLCTRLRLQMHKIPALVFVPAVLKANRKLKFHAPGWGFVELIDLYNHGNGNPKYDFFGDLVFNYPAFIFEFLLAVALTQILFGSPVKAVCLTIFAILVLNNSFVKNNLTHGIVRRNKTLICYFGFGG